MGGMWLLQVGVQGPASTPTSPKSEPYGRRAEGSDIPRWEAHTAYQGKRHMGSSLNSDPPLRTFFY